MSVPKARYERNKVCILWVLGQSSWMRGESTLPPLLCESTFRGSWSKRGEGVLPYHYCLWRMERGERLKTWIMRGEWSLPYLKTPGRSEGNLGHHRWVSFGVLWWGMRWVSGWDRGGYTSPPSCRSEGKLGRGIRWVWGWISRGPNWLNSGAKLIVGRSLLGSEAGSGQRIVFCMHYPMSSSIRGVNNTKYLFLCQCFYLLNITSLCMKVRPYTLCTFLLLCLTPPVKVNYETLWAVHSKLNKYWVLIKKSGAGSSMTATYQAGVSPGGRCCSRDG